MGGIVLSMLVVSNIKHLSFVKLISYFFRSTLFRGSGILHTLAKTTPLLIVSLGLLVAFKASVWNIGAEGQIVFGIIGTLGATLFLDVPVFAKIIMAFLLSFLGGGVWAAIAGVFKAKWNVPEIPVTLMQNFLALALMSFLISGPWISPEPGYSRTSFLPQNVRFPFLIDPLNSTFLIALALVPVVYWLMNKSVLGYRLSATGASPSAAAVAGLNPKRTIVIGMFISGGICALAGSCLILGEYFFGVEGLSSGYGFYGIVSVLLAELNVIMVPFTSFFVAFVLMGSSAITNVGVPGPFVNLTMGIVFIAALIRIVIQKVTRK
jgi:simple sugar transport system permease protein